MGQLCAASDAGNISPTCYGRADRAERERERGGWGGGGVVERRGGREGKYGHV